MALTQIQQAALQLHAVGLNVVPHPLTSHKAYPWQKLIYTRLPRAQVPEAFAGRCNLGIMAGGRIAPYPFFLYTRNMNLFKICVAKLQAAEITPWAFIFNNTGYLLLLSQYRRMATREAEINQVGVIGKERYVPCPPSMDRDLQRDWYCRSGDKPPLIHFKDCQIAWLGLEPEKAVDKRPRWEILRGKNRSSSESEQEGQTEETQDKVDKQKPPAERKRHQPISHLQGMAAYLQAHHIWQGKDGLSDLAVMKALFERGAMEMHLKRQIRASVREVAELAHIDPQSR